MPLIPKDTFDLIMISHTTEDISDFHFALQFAYALKKMFSDIVVSWGEDNDDEIIEHIKHFEKMSKQELQKIYAKGGIYFSDPDEVIWHSFINWHKYKISKREYLRRFAAGLEQNTCELMTSSLFLENPFWKEMYIELSIKMAQLFKSNYLYCYALNTGFDHFFTSQSGLEIGLKDIYWLNIFGTPYIEMIGREKLLSCPAYEVREIEDKHILIQPLEQVAPAGDEQMRSQCNKIKDHIGRQFFVCPKIKPKYSVLNKSGIISFFDLIKFFWAINRNFKDERDAATVRPKFNWSNIFVTSSKK